MWERGGAAPTPRKVWRQLIDPPKGGDTAGARNAGGGTRSSRWNRGTAAAGGEGGAPPAGDDDWSAPGRVSGGTWADVQVLFCGQFKYAGTWAGGRMYKFCLVFNMSMRVSEGHLGTWADVQVLSSGQYKYAGEWGAPWRMGGCTSFVLWSIYLNVPLTGIRFFLGRDTTTLFVPRTIAFGDHLCPDCGEECVAS